MENRKPVGFKLLKRPSRLALGAVVAMLLAVAGVITLRASSADTPQTRGEDGASIQDAANNEPVVATVKYGDGKGRGGLQPHGMGFAPYAFIPYGNVVMVDFGEATGVKNFFAAFVLGSECTPFWDGNATLGLDSRRSVAILSDINSIGAKGGDVAVSFGGFAGRELANTCTDATRLQAAYQSVIDKYGINHINFDLEHEGLTDTVAMARRTQVIADLQRANPTLKVSLTILVTPTGLNADGVKTLRTFGSQGVVLSSIHIMAMNFGDDLPGMQSERIKSAAQGTINQLKEMYPSATAEQLWQTLGITVMIGRNDTAEMFTLDDARVVRGFAIENRLGTLSYWSANRDLACPDGNVQTSATCSSVQQTKYQFAELLKIPQ